MWAQRNESEGGFLDKEVLGKVIHPVLALGDTTLVREEGC